MTRRTWLLALVLAVALAVTTVGWIRASDRVQLVEDEPARFETCQFDGSTLLLGYFYGANQRLAPSVDTRQHDKIVVELQADSGSGTTVSTGLGGRARFSIFGADRDTRIEYTDGRQLDCERPAEVRTGGAR